MRQQIQKLAETTSAHGPGHAVESGSWTGTAYWTAITIVALSFAMYQSKDLFNQYRSGSIHSSLMPVDVLKEGTDHVKITYCSDDWVDLDKLNKSSLSVSDFVYFMTLIPGLIPRQEQIDLPYKPINKWFNLTEIHSVNYSDTAGSGLGNTYVSTTTIHVGYTKPESEIEQAATNLREFAIEHKITNMLDFARYFARQNVAVGNTREIGQTLAFGRYCRQLEVVQLEDGEQDCQAKGQLSSRIGFQVKYDMNFGLPPGYSSSSNPDWEQQFPKHVAILPMTGLGIVSEQLQNQIIEEALSDDTPDLHKVNRGIKDVRLGQFYTRTVSASIQGLSAMPMVISFALDSKIQHRPNAGQSPCNRNENDKAKLPTLYNKWICREKCSAKVIQQGLKEDSGCDFVGSYAESLDVEVPCSCENALPGIYERGNIGNPKTIECEIMKSILQNNDCGISTKRAELNACLKACDSDDILPDCITYDNRLSRVQEVQFFDDKLLFSFEDMYGKYNLSDFATGEVLLHIDVNVGSMVRITEYLATDLTDFIVGLGGTAGFFLGFSIVTVIHCVTVLAKAPYDLMKARKAAEK